MSATRCLALAAALHPDSVDPDVVLRVDHDAAPAARVAACVVAHERVAARVDAPDGAAAIGALDAHLCALARERLTALSLALGLGAPDAPAQRTAALAEQLAASERALADASRALASHASRFGVLAAAVHDLAAGRATYASDVAGLPADVADAVAALARRVDPQPAVGVDRRVWVRRSDVAALCDREAVARGRVSSVGLALAYVGGLVTSGLELPPHLRGSADGGGQ